mgnify:FL=1
MKKIKSFIKILLISILIAGCYGIIHDLITSSICPEYYTKFKFFQFGIMDDYQRPFRGNLPLMASIVGFLATWWFGLLLGFILSVFGLVFKLEDRFIEITLNSIFLVIIVGVFFGFCAYIFGSLNANYNLSYNLYEQKIIEIRQFNLVGLIHNFSYLGGIIGLIIGITNQKKNWFLNKLKE